MATTLTGQIVEALGAAGSVTALVPATSIYMGELPEGTSLPLIQVELTGVEVQLNFGAARIESASISIVSYAVGAAAVTAIQKAAESTISPLAATYATSRIMACMLNSTEIAPSGREKEGDLTFMATSKYTILIEVS